MDGPDRHRRWAFASFFLMNWIVPHLWLIPAIPLAASLLILSLNASRRTAASLIAVLAQLAAFFLSIAAFVPTLQIRAHRAFQNFTWFTFGHNAVRLGWLLDPLTAVMLVMITLVSLC